MRFGASLVDAQGELLRVPRSGRSIRLVGLGGKLCRLMTACSGSTIRRRDKGERHQPPDVAADASALRDFHQRCCPTRNRIIKPPTRVRNRLEQRRVGFGRARVADRNDELRSDPAPVSCSSD